MRASVLFAGLIAIACGAPPAVQGPPPPDEPSCVSGCAALPACEGRARVDVATRACVDVGWTGPCPAGFAPDVEAGCAPVLAEKSCAPGTMPLLGQAACVPVGVTTCGAVLRAPIADWACTADFPATACATGMRERLGQTSCQKFAGCIDPLPADADLFVNPAFTTAQLDARHYRTLTAALAVAASGARIAVAAGSYKERLDLAKPVTFIGQCAQQVAIDGQGAAGPAVRVRAAVAMSGLRITGGSPGARVEAGSLTLNEVEVEANTGAGVEVVGGASLTATNSALRRTIASAAGGDGQGVRAQGCGRVSLTGSVVASNERAGVSASGAGCTLVLDRVLLRDTKAATGGAGPGLAVLDGASAAATDCVATGNAGAAILASGGGARVELLRGLVTSTKPVAGSGVGVVAERGASVIARELNAERNATGVLLAKDATTTATLSDSTLTGRASCQSVGGSAETCRGVAVTSGAVLSMTRTALVNVAGIALRVRDAGSRATLERVSIGDTLQVDDRGSDVSVADGGVVVAKELWAGYAPGTSVEARGAGSAVSLSASVVTHSGVAKLWPSGCLRLADGGAATVDGTLLERCLGGGVLLDGTAQPVDAHVTRSLVRDGPPTSLGLDGLGLDLQGDTATATVEDSAFVRAAALAVSGYEGTVRLARVSLVDTQPTEAGEGGYGIGADSGLRLDAEDVAIRGGSTVGVGATEVPHLALRRVLVAGVAPEKKSGAFGYGLSLEVAMATLEGVEVRGTSVGLACADCSATLASTVLRGNDVGVHVQGATTLEQGDPAALRPGVVVLSDDSELDGNGTKVGAGDLPLPRPPKR